MALDGTECNCPRSHPCLGVQFGKCRGSGREEDYYDDADVLDKCFDERFPDSVPCINGYVIIPKGKLTLVKILHRGKSNCSTYKLLDIAI